MFTPNLKSTNFRNIILGLFITSCLSGCEFLKMKEETPENKETQSLPVARAHETYLYPEDLEGIQPGLSVEDSINLVERYINSWVKKQLLIKEASSKIEFNEAELQRKILNYRYALMVYEYKKHYINNTLNKEVSEEEIVKYYEGNIENFELKQNIIRGIYIKIPNEAPQLEKLTLLINSSQYKEQEELKSYCLRFATAYSLEDSTWINFDEVVEDSPMNAILNKVQFLKENRYIETSDDRFSYFLRIDEYKISDQISPLEFVKDQIRNIIINKRKVELANNLEDEVFDRAVNNNDFEIYNN